MNLLTYYLQQYGLSAVLVIGLILAVSFVYKYWDKIVIKGSGRK
ncbi:MULTISPECIES: hypothetical protein [unclassified Paenibacillus]|nr:MULTISPECIES: hypothetical protein [unclassified Paenibacillus]MBP1153876.1 cytochrome oxidase assembly protein ShyY1 [Paenibacillus sp. PvP091]MBP1170739.1 cytochrome oxidase assembly protein ShyY1 [Paenibacillus sp. PvR098]MBP2441767.1 cytochrome oxidase assembly protein ShyY1 [Paenibacillus sp. PvP052]